MSGARVRTSILAISLMAIACQGPSASAPTPTSAPTVPPPPSPTAATPPTPSSGLPALELPDMNTIVADGGRYTFSGFAPRVTLALEGNTWRLGPKIAGFFALVRSANGESAIILRFVRPTAIFSGPDTSVEATTAAAAVATLQGNAAVVDKGTSEGRIGGLIGTVIELDSASSEVPKVMLAGTISFTIEAGTRMWVAFFDLPDGLFALQVLGSSAEWERDLALVEPVLESVTIGQ